MKSLVSRIAVLVVVAGVLVVGLRLRSSARFQELRKSADDACAAYRKKPGNADAHVCRYDAFDPTPPAPARVRAAEARIAEAKAALARGEVARGEDVLRTVMAEARAADRCGSLTDEMVAGDVVNRVLDVVEAHRERLGDAAVLGIVGSGVLASAEHPLEAARIERMWILAHYGEQKLPDAPWYTERELAAQMERDDAAIREMERALLRGDREGCERATKDLGPVSGFLTVVCRPMESVVRASARTRAEVARAMVTPR